MRACESRLTADDHVLLARAIGIFKSEPAVGRTEFLADPATVVLIALDPEDGIIGWAWGTRPGREVIG
jgi:hypothetical protein